MSKTFAPSPAVESYIRAVALKEHPLLTRLREETAAHPEAQMQITPEQGQLLQVLVRATGARRTLEIGVFTGYSSLAVALALPEDGRIIALDASPDYTSVARRYWKEAGVDRKIDLRLGKASDLLDALLTEGAAGSFDFAFIDADKASYAVYFEKARKLVRKGGLIAVDNTLQEGRVADPSHAEPNTLAIREFNQMLHNHAQVQSVLLPIADGLTLAVTE